MYDPNLPLDRQSIDDIDTDNIEDEPVDNF
jgi:hypothetical protein